MQNPVFDLHKLGWKAFEDLIACVLKETLGQTFQMFADGVDGGRDGAFYGTWTQGKEDTLLSGSFTIQCKHTSKSGMSLPSVVISEELPKVTRLAADGLVDVYILFTNYSLPATGANKAEAEIRQAGAKHAIIYGAEWINHCIASNPSLRRLVPRLYGLGDLTQIVTHQAYRQAKEVLDSLSPDLACFVPTEAYRKCAHALKEHGFVMLIGEPASGKTMIANLMALSAADEWDLQTLIINVPEDLERLWNPDDPGQFFWVDDAFGSNQFDPRRVQEWNQRLSQLRIAIHKGARAVFTSRSYIFKAAQGQLNMHKFELFNDSRIMIEVEKLSDSERAMILYNHLKLGKQPKKFLKEVKDFLPKAIITPKFLPEIARRFSIPKFTTKLSRTEDGISDFFRNPVAIMEDIIKGLANAEKAAIALVFVNGGNLPIPLPQDAATEKSVASMQSTIGDVKAALLSLDDSMLRKVTIGNSQFWQFRHPTIRDAFASIIGSNPEQIEIYLSGATKERLIAEISCGEMSIEGVKVIVPQSFFDRVLQIVEAGDRVAALVEPMIYFLARKCSIEFLRRYFDEVKYVSLLPNLIGLPYLADSALTIIVRLREANLLPNEIRLLAVERIRVLAEAHLWDGFIDGDLIGKLVTEDENKNLLSGQKNFIYSNQKNLIDDIEAGWDSDDDVDDVYYDLRRLVQRFLEENESLYGEDEYSGAESGTAQVFIDAIESRISSMKLRQSDRKDYDELEAEDTSAGTLVSGRSIFDDIDE